MKLIYQGDPHIRDGRPANRIDNYQAAEFGKLEQLVGFCNEHEADLFLGGDLFDDYKVSAETVNITNKILSGVKGTTFAVMGQHDCPYHQVSRMKSPVMQLYTSGSIFALENEGSYPTEDYNICFCGWEKEPDELLSERFNILLGHISVFEKEIPFYFKGKAFTARSLKKKYPGFDLYLCGDIHQPFVRDGVIVSGSMMRQSIDQIDYKPRCYLIDTDTMDIKPLYYKIEQEVFSIPDPKVETTWDMEMLVGAMKSAALGKESYKRDCLALSVEDEPVKNIIEGVFDDID